MPYALADGFAYLRRSLKRLTAFANMSFYVGDRDIPFENNFLGAGSYGAFYGCCWLDHFRFSREYFGNGLSSAWRVTMPQFFSSLHLPGGRLEAPHRDLLTLGQICRDWRRPFIGKVLRTVAGRRTCREGLRINPFFDASLFSVLSYQVLYSALVRSFSAPFVVTKFGNLPLDVLFTDC